MINHIGRNLEPQEVVHHLDSNWKNNSIENLHLFKNQRDHIIYHENLRRWIRQELGIYKTPKDWNREGYLRHKNRYEKNRIIKRRETIQGVLCFLCGRSDFKNELGLKLHLSTIHDIKSELDKDYQKKWYIKNKERISLQNKIKRKRWNNEKTKSNNG